MLADHKQGDKRTTMKNQNRSAALRRPAMKLMGRGWASTSLRSTNLFKSLKKGVIKTRGVMHLARSNIGPFNSDGHVTLRLIVQYSQNSNLSEILCRSWIPAIKTESDMPWTSSHLKRYIARRSSNLIFLALKGK